MGRQGGDGQPPQCRVPLHCCTRAAPVNGRQGGDGLSDGRGEVKVIKGGEGDGGRSNSRDPHWVHVMGKATAEAGAPSANPVRSLRGREISTRTMQFANVLPPSHHLLSQVADLQPVDQVLRQARPDAGVEAPQLGRQLGLGQGLPAG